MYVIAMKHQFIYLFINFVCLTYFDVMALLRVRRFVKNSLSLSLLSASTFVAVQPDL